MKDETRLMVEKEGEIAVRIGSGEIPIYKVRINFDSGISEDFWAKKFSIGMTDEGAREISWVPLVNGCKPVSIIMSKVESAWIVDVDTMLPEMPDSDSVVN